MGLFWGFVRGSTWGYWGGGTVYVSICVFGGILGVLFCKSKWGYQRCTGNEVFTLKNNVRDELFDWGTSEGRAVWLRYELFDWGTSEGRAVWLRYNARDELFDWGTMRGTSCLIEVRAVWLRYNARDELFDWGTMREGYYREAWITAESPE
jgi:hypothetical protein